MEIKFPCFLAQIELDFAKCVLCDLDNDDGGKNRLGAFDKFRKKANKFFVSDIPLASKISAPTAFNSFYVGRV
jgi:hypothetical protein